MSKESGTSTCYTIGGIQVAFPYKPYPSQIAIMDKAIRSVVRSQNCLLESPTGSGKTLALLCPILAWQQAEYAKLHSEVDCFEENQNIDDEDDMGCCSGDKPTPCDRPAKSSSAFGETEEDDKCKCPSRLRDLKSFCFTPRRVTSSTKTTTVEAPTPSGSPSFDNLPVAAANSFSSRVLHPRGRHLEPVSVATTTNIKGTDVKSIGLDDDNDFDDFKLNKRRSIASSTPLNTKSDLKTLGNDEVEGKISLDQPKNGGKQKPLPKKRVPKIFFGTRTHKQIAQIVRELRKTDYRNVRMCILASRNHTCIHETVSADPRKDEVCRNMIKSVEEEKCKYYIGSTKFRGQSSLINAGLCSAWDIEDLVKVGQQRRACPYYIIRAVSSDADIIFCPYNYLIDPLVRNIVNINLSDNVVVFDEAHNIEDVSREAASFSVNECELKDASKNLTHIGNFQSEDVAVSYVTLSRMISALHDWLQNHSAETTTRSIDKGSTVMSGTNIVAHLSHIGLGPDQFGTFLTCLKDARERDQEFGLTFALAGITSKVLDGLEMILGILYNRDMRFVDDYRIVILKELSTKYNANASGDHFFSRHSANWVASLNFWCLNPAVAFAYLNDSVRNIILTSGTLSPMDSFQSELGVSFPIKLETNHVIDKSQVWMRSFGWGPNAVPLISTFQNSETFVFQDEIGVIVSRICKIVPHGILLFVSSYSFLAKLCDRWRSNGLYEEISKKKVIFREPRGSDQSKLEDTLSGYFDVINASAGTKVSNQKKDKGKKWKTLSLPDGVNGALMIAVCRGKVSEGLDFPDNFARAVITCGIPFPSVKDLQVELKRKFNDVHQGSRGLLSGSRWYEIQAFRAINQALGRLIRHRLDWGALILLDRRFEIENRYVKPLSKWIRGNIRHENDFCAAMDSLEEFMEFQMKRESDHQNLRPSGHKFQSSESHIDGHSEDFSSSPLGDSGNDTFFSSNLQVNLIESSLSSRFPISTKVIFPNAQTVVVPLPVLDRSKVNLLVPSSLKRSSKLHDVKTTAAHHVYLAYPCVPFTSTPTQVGAKDFNCDGGTNGRSLLTVARSQSSICSGQTESESNLKQQNSLKPEVVNDVQNDKHCVEVLREVGNQTPPLFPSVSDESLLTKSKLPLDDFGECQPLECKKVVNTKVVNRPKKKFRPLVRLPYDYFED